MSGKIESEGLSDSRRWQVLAGVWLIYFSFGMIVAAMAPMVSEIRNDIEMNNAVMGIVLGAWPISYILCAVPCGILLDRFGARRMLAAATIVMAASAFARYFAGSPVQLFLAVALFGAGGPLISVGAPVVIAKLYSGQARATAMGLYVTGPYLGGLVALAITNSVLMPLTGQSWRTVMAIYGGLTLCGGLIWILVSARDADRFGSGQGASKYNPSAFAEIVGVPQVRLILIISVGIFFVNHAFNNWLPEVLRDHGLSAVVSGYYASLPAAVGILGVLIIPRLATANRLIPFLGLLFGAVMLASILLQFPNNLPLTAGLILQGLARGSMMTLAIMLLMETPGVPEERLGLAVGMFFAAAEIGGVLGPVTFGALAYLSAGFAVPLIAITSAAASLLGALVLLWRLRFAQEQ